MRVIVVGAGLIGRTIARLLHRSGSYALTVVDQQDGALAQLDTLGQAGVVLGQVHLGDPAVLQRTLVGHDVVVNALPFHQAIPVATAACAAGVHYFDLTEDVRATRAIRALAEGAPTVLMPQCGLAPGFIGIAAHDLVQRFDTVRTVKMRVGALPRYPTNALKYNLTWSLDGLINEYLEPCEAIRDGQTQWVEPLEGLEHFALDGVDYEAFNTSGGLGTLCETLDGQVTTMDYKSVRYPGHRDRMAFLLQDLRLGEDRATLARVLRHALPTTEQDVVLVMVSVTGERNGHLVEEVLVRKVHARQEPDGGEVLSAIQATTAGSLCAVVDLFREGVLPQRGFVRQEQVPLAAFLANRFGGVYDGLPSIS